MKPFNIIGLGEVLWDVLPDGKQLGGAPANFAYTASRLGNRGIVLSRVGDDANGAAILDELKAKNLSTEHIQIDQKNPTGTVKVKLENGQPEYEIIEPVAWDFLESSDDWREIAANADAVCFGSLAQRGDISRKTIREFVELSKGWRIFDVNLRQNYFSAEILCESLRLANIVKLNHEELPQIVEMFETAGADKIAQAENLREKFDLNYVCVTRGAAGSILIKSGEVSEHGGEKAEIADTIGAGDAFTAALTHGVLRDWKLSEINEFANRVGAFVASKTGAMPEVSREFR